MGNVYCIFCMDCKTYEHIGKEFWDMVPTESCFKSCSCDEIDEAIRSEVADLNKSFKEESHDENGLSVQENIDWFMFRAMKITGFLTDHQGHRIRIDHDNSDFYEKFVEDQDVWGRDETNTTTGGEIFEKQRLQL